MQEYMIYLGVGLPLLAITYLSIYNNKYVSIKEFIAVGYVAGIIYPITESFFRLAIPGFQYLTSGPYVLDTPLHMSLLLVFTIIEIGYLSFRLIDARTKNAQIYLFVSGFLATLVIENFSVEAGMWWFADTWINTWHMPLCILLSETISLGLLHYFLRLLRKRNRGNSNNNNH